MLHLPLRLLPLRAPLLQGGLFGLLSCFQPLRRFQPGLRQPALLADADPGAFLLVALVLKAQDGKSVNAALLGGDVPV